MRALIQDDALNIRNEVTYWGSYWIMLLILKAKFNLSQKYIPRKAYLNLDPIIISFRLRLNIAGDLL